MSHSYCPKLAISSKIVFLTCSGINHICGSNLNDVVMVHIVACHNHNRKSCARVHLRAKLYTYNHIVSLTSLGLAGTLAVGGFVLLKQLKYSYVLFLEDFVVEEGTCFAYFVGSSSNSFL
jgi:hypothetical protein